PACRLNRSAHAACRHCTDHRCRGKHRRFGHVSERCSFGEFSRHLNHSCTLRYSRASFTESPAAVVRGGTLPGLPVFGRSSPCSSYRPCWVAAACSDLLRECMHESWQGQNLLAPTFPGRLCQVPAADSIGDAPE